MSFFVSKEIEEIVDETCLVDPEKPKEHGVHLFEVETSTAISMLDEMSATDDRLFYEVSFRGNTNTIEKLFLKKINLNVKMGATKIDLDSYHIINLKRILDDSYIIKLRCRLSEVNNNV